jgi:hypothetical protein
MTKMKNPPNAQTETPSAIPSRNNVSARDAKDEQLGNTKLGSNKEEAFTFHMNEYNTLRKEMEMRNQELLKLQTYAVIGTFAAWSWLATTSRPLPKFIWYLPTILTILCFTKARTHLGGIFRSAEYLRELEKAVPKLPPLQGWENFVQDKRVKGLGRWSWNLTFWIILIIATIVIPSLV